MLDDKITELVWLHADDCKLGEQVRKLYWEHYIDSKQSGDIIAPKDTRIMTQTIQPETCAICGRSTRNMALQDLSEGNCITCID